MRTLYHEEHEPQRFPVKKVKKALGEGWVKSPRDLTHERMLKYFPHFGPPVEPAKTKEKPVDVEHKPKKKYPSQMNVKELKEEGLKWGRTFTGETKKEMRKEIESLKAAAEKTSKNVLL